MDARRPAGQVPVVLRAELVVEPSGPPVHHGVSSSRTASIRSVSDPRSPSPVASQPVNAATVMAPSASARASRRG